MGAGAPKVSLLWPAPLLPAIHHQRVPQKRRAPNRNFLIISPKPRILHIHLPKPHMGLRTVTRPKVQKPRLVQPTGGGVVPPQRQSFSTNS